MQTILYKVHHNLYVNLTNKCPCACTFCLRQTRDHMEDSGVLWLDHEPSVDEVIAEFAKFDMSQYEEVVFCGFGEPTEALEVLLPVAKYVKETFSKPVRINTNGLGNLIWNRDITPEFKGLIDTVSISLNSSTAQKYLDVTRNRFGLASYDAMLSFAKACQRYVPNVVMTVVDVIGEEEVAACQKVCDTHGLHLRVRPYEAN